MTESQRNKMYYGDDDGPPFKNAKDNARWPDGIIPYVISSNDAKFQDVVLDGIKSFNHKTCLKFVPRNSEKYYINIRDDGDRCSSSVGRVTEKDLGGNNYFENGQTVYLGKGCWGHDT